MPIHFKDLDVTQELKGVRSALIVPCNVCPAVTVSVRENKPFMQLYKSFLKSQPFEEYLELLQTRLKEKGVTTKVFKNHLYHHWFMCMWPEARQNKLRKEAEHYDAVIVIGCESATVTVNDSIDSLRCRVIEGMRVSGIMNAKLKVSPLGNISFVDHKTIPLSDKTDIGSNDSITDALDPLSQACPPKAVVGCLH